MLPTAIEKLIEDFSSLPGVGPKSATRMAFYLLIAPPQVATKIAQHLSALEGAVQICEKCFNYCDNKLCRVCNSSERNQQQIMIVENALDVLAFESANYQGLYHVLGGLISPLQGIGPEQVRISQLVNRLVTEHNQQPNQEIEVILALTTSLEGESTAMYVTNSIKEQHLGDSVKVTRLARGLPTNSTIEYQDPSTLSSSLNNRTIV